MLFVTLCSPKPNYTPAQSSQRRLAWKYPRGIKYIAEYWLQTNTPHVIAIYEADDIAPMIEVNETWGDIFDITVVPAISAEEGLKLVSQMVPKT